MTAWAADDKMLASAYNDIDIIDWSQDRLINILYKQHAPLLDLTNFITSKHGRENKQCYSCDLYILPIKNALNIQLRYHTHYCYKKNIGAGDN